ncbi:hypothetical protein NT6N_38140 [Oceaniferula spumae]|uniref:Uncharacterized protein n=1 Tax=Oceaniferula spumae TaxID=2979115 RepID=A0AAT9FS90_9BACT
MARYRLAEKGNRVLMKADGFGEIIPAAFTIGDPVLFSELSNRVNRS